MSVNLSRVNMTLILIFLFLTIMNQVYSKEVYVPVLIWTSGEFRGRKNVDYLALKKVTGDIFEAHIMELLGNKKPLVVVFLEQDLSTDDFQWRDDDGNTSFPFLSKLTVNSRVDYFRSVESPHETITRLKSKGYKLKHLKPGAKFDFNEGDLFVVEFQKIKGRRPETMKKHDEQMEEIHRQLFDSGKNWISIYTARNADEKGYFTDLKQMSPWHVEEQVHEKPTRALSLYQDEFTGFTLITKGSVGLLLPSPRNRVLKKLEDYTTASAKPSSKQDVMDFIIWFPNYTITFHLNQEKGDWIIKQVKLLNANGDILKLTSGQEPTFLDNKCYVQLTEFKSKGKPVVKVILSKYKFLKLQTLTESCQKPYGFHLTVSLILVSILYSVVCLNKLLGSCDFSRKLEKAKISISPDKLLPLGAKAIY